MILVNALPGVDTTEDGDRHEVLDDTDHRLQNNSDVSNQTKNAVRRDKVRMRALVNLDNNKGSYKKDHAE